MRKRFDHFFRQFGLLFGLILCCGASPLVLANTSAALSIHAADRGKIEARVAFLHEMPGRMGIAQVQKQISTTFKPLQAETMFNLNPEDALWIRLDMTKAESVKDNWVIWIALPLIDSVTLYQVKGDAVYQQRAGDRVPQSQWAEAGRYPRFHVDLPPGNSTLYLKVQGSTPISVPLQLGSVLTSQQEDRLGMLGLGSIAGVLATLVLVCLVTAYAYKDRLYLFYGVYVSVMILAVSAYTGLASYLIWPESPLWADAAQGCLAIITAGGAMYFIESLLGGRQFAKRLSMALLGVGAASVPLALVYYFLERSLGVVLMGAYMIVVTGIGLSLAVRAWQRGDRVGKWVFFAYLPLAAAVLLAIARAYGWVTVSWLVQYGVVAALVIEIPFMMLALNLRSRQRHEIQTRGLGLTTQDALTGLLAEHIFDDRLRQTTMRYAKRKEDAAVVLISLVNYEHISLAYGLPVAEQSVLRAVIKLRKVLRDADTVARLGTSQFGLILEGIDHRAHISEIGARLIAQGLMPLPGLVPEVTLQFHVASALMREADQPDAEIKKALLQLLGSMSPRTRRPIRFLEPVIGGVLTVPVSAKIQPFADVEPAVEFASTMTSPLSNSQDAMPSTQFEERSGWEESSGASADATVIPHLTPKSA